MLKTNGSVSSREEYNTDVGSLVLLPARNPADRSPLGLVEFTIQYRFAGVHQPGVALVPRPLPDDSQEMKVLKDKISSLTTALSVVTQPQSRSNAMTAGELSAH